MLKIINKKEFIEDESGDPELNDLIKSYYAHRKFALVNADPVYMENPGWAIAKPGHEILFVLDELRFTLKYLITRKKIVL